MKIIFKTKKLESICQSERAVVKKYNLDVATNLWRMMNYISNATSFLDIYNFPRARMHLLKGNRKEQYAIDLGKMTGFRLIVVPLDENGDIIENTDVCIVNIQCKSIRIEEVSHHYE